MKNRPAQPVTSIVNAYKKNLKISKEMRERLIRDFMDSIILKELRTGVNLSGYDVMSLFNRRFRMLLSSGSVYSTLYAMEREGLVVGTVNDRKRVYKLTKKGEEKIQSILRNLDGILSFIRSLLGEKSNLNHLEKLS